MSHSHPTRTGEILPVNPDSLLAEYLERHIHLYLDIGLCLMCLLLMCGVYSAAQALLDYLR